MEDGSRFKRFFADLYLEGNDHFRGWFNSLLTCVAVNSISLIKVSLLMVSPLLIAKGQKMSKSKNNVIDPQKIINSSGADITQDYRVASEDYSWR